jgi:hypothetical protein
MAVRESRCRKGVPARQVGGPRHGRSVGIKTLVVADDRAEHERLPCERARLPVIEVRAQEVGGSEGRPVKREDGELVHRTAVLSQGRDRRQADARRGARDEQRPSLLAVPVCAAEALDRSALELCLARGE